MKPKIDSYEVMNRWTNKSLLETYYFEHAVEFAIQAMKENKHDEIQVIAIINIESYLTPKSRRKE